MAPVNERSVDAQKRSLAWKPVSTLHRPRLIFSVLQVPSATKEPAGKTAVVLEGEGPVAIDAPHANGFALADVPEAGIKRVLAIFPEKPLLMSTAA